MEGKNKFSIILLVIIAALAVALAGLTIVVLTRGSSDTKTAEKAVQVTRPAESEVTVKQILDKKAFNLKIGNDKKNTYAQISAEIVYLNKVTGIKDTTLKITAFDGEIKEIIGTYFENLTLEDFQKTDAKAKAKEELKKRINECLNSNEKTKNDIVYQINFQEWLYQ